MIITARYSSIVEFNANLIRFCELLYSSIIWQHSAAAALGPYGADFSSDNALRVHCVGSESLASPGAFFACRHRYTLRFIPVTSCLAVFALRSSVSIPLIVAGNSISGSVTELSICSSLSNSSLPDSRTAAAALS